MREKPAPSRARSTNKTHSRTWPLGTNVAATEHDALQKLVGGTTKYVNIVPCNVRSPNVSQSSVFKLESSFGSDGSGPGHFAGEIGYFAFNKTSRKIYAPDVSGHRVQIFSGSGAYESNFGSSGGADGQCNQPKGMALYPQDNLYVVDHANHRVGAPGRT